jgi:methionine biosynthesis protein MetW
MSVTRYSRDVDLDDLNNVHTFAVRAVPPGSRVLDLGAGEGSVSRVLAARGCAVLAVERDADGVAALAAHGVPALQADLETLAEADLPRAGFDVVLLLDVLEHLVDPASVLARSCAWLAPGGRLLISVPHVAHGAVRLSLLQGQFPRTETGLLDRTHLHFFDVPQVQALLARAGVRALDTLTVERSIDETELPGAGVEVPPEVLETIAADPLSRVYQFFIVAAPGQGGGVTGGLLEALMGRVRALEGHYRSLEDYSARIESEGRLRDEASRAELQRAIEQVAHADTRLRELTAAQDAWQAQRGAGHAREAAAERALQAAGAALREAEARASHLEARVAELILAHQALRAQHDEGLGREAAAARALDQSRIDLRQMVAHVTDLERHLRELREAYAGVLAQREAGLGREAEAARALEGARTDGVAMAVRVADAEADQDMLRRHLTERMAELTQASETVAVLLRDVAVQREFAASLAAQVPRIAARGGEEQVLAELDRYRDVASTPAAAAALAAEAADFRRLQGALAIRALARLDAVSRRLPRVRSALRTFARRVVG